VWGFETDQWFQCGENIVFERVDQDCTTAGDVTMTFTKNASNKEQGTSVLFQYLSQLVMIFVIVSVHMQAKTEKVKVSHCCRNENSPGASVYSPVQIECTDADTLSKYVCTAPRVCARTDKIICHSIYQF
jgi:hypothetical protein